MLKINESYNQQEVTTKKSDTLELSLAENPTTGYRWDVTSSGEPVCKLDETDYEPGGSGLGRGGTRRWKFLVLAPGVATIALEYRRPFETGKAPSKTFTVRVRATE
jgi:inhibitor of cysteine peptidase